MVYVWDGQHDQLENSIKQIVHKLFGGKRIFMWIVSNETRELHGCYNYNISELQLQAQIVLKILV